MVGDGSGMVSSTAELHDASTSHHEDLAATSHTWCCEKDEENTKYMKILKVFCNKYLLYHKEK